MNIKRIGFLLLALVCVSLSARIGYSDIAGTAHDFGAAGATWNTTGEICAPCHTPHNADTSVAQAPLWSHEVTAATFTTYSSSTLTATDVAAPDGISKLCLSCHDGTVALENFGGTGGGTTFISGGSNVGTNLTGDHPISFTYDTALATADGELFNPSTQASGIFGSTGTVAADMLFAGKLECASCHDPHGRTDGTGPVPKLLIKRNTGSALCLTCHDK